MSLVLRNLLFTAIMPAAIAGYLPSLILAAGGTSEEPAIWAGAIPIRIGVALFLWCLWLFATVGRGTPGPWDAPREFVAVGPYRWVRNPMYMAVLLTVAGEVLLFLSVPLLVYLVVLAAVVHVFVVIYEEPALTEKFGGPYRTYLRLVPRWIPRPPGGKAA